MIIKEFGQHLKEVRQQVGISQEKFALKVAMDRTYYASLEAPKRHTALENIRKIADGFDVTLANLFKGLEDKTL